MADLVHELQRKFPTATISHGPLSVWVGNVLYVDDLALISTDPDELQAMINLCQRRGERLRMQINAQKSQVVAFHEFKDTKSARTQPRKVRRAGGCGEQWEAVGSSQPKTGRSLRCDELTEALGRRHDFSPEALRAFRIHDQGGNCVTELRPSDYVKSGNSYYKPKVYDKAWPAPFHILSLFPCRLPD